MTSFPCSDAESHLAERATNTAAREEFPASYAHRERGQCGRCGMSFVVGEPLRDNAERLGCPDCGMKFWSVLPFAAGIAVCGTTEPERLVGIGPRADRLRP